MFDITTSLIIYLNVLDSNEGPLASFKVSTYNVQTFLVRSKINLKHTVLCKISSGDVSASDILNL